jgi:hypothetical protein
VIENDTAIKLLDYLAKHIATHDKPIVGYTTMADELGYTEKDGRVIGQVCSRIDYACFLAGLPMLSSHWVRNAKGEVNPDSFSGSWKSYQAEIEALSATFNWTDEALQEIKHKLNGLPDRSSKVLWEEVLRREAQKIGYIRYNLHRNIDKYKKDIEHA